MFKVHLVEDNEMLRDVLVIYLKRINCHVHAFSSADQYLSCIKKDDFQPPDILLSDIQMPGTNGLVMSQKVQSIYPNVTIMMMSGNHCILQDKQAQHLNIKHAFFKPFKLTALGDAVASCTKTSTIN